MWTTDVQVTCRLSKQRACDVLICFAVTQVAIYESCYLCMRCIVEHPVGNPGVISPAYRKMQAMHVAHAKQGI